MATLEERVSKLEARVGEHFLGVDDLRGLISRVDAKIDRLDEKLDRRFDALSNRIDGFDQKLDRRIDGLDHRFSRQFNMLLVFHLTTLGAILVGLLTR